LNPSRLPRLHDAELVEALTAKVFISTAVIALIETRSGLVYSKVGLIPASAGLRQLQTQELPRPRSTPRQVTSTAIPT
jgi:hypothetical protein